MPLFICSNCECIENTALCHYWFRMGKKLCSQCDPSILNWHGAFDRIKATEKDKSNVIDGFIQVTTENT